MTKIDLGAVGISLDLSEDGSHLARAVELERLGYSTLWLSGGQLQSLEPIAEIIRATEKIRVGSAIIPLDMHDDDAVTDLYKALAEEHPGRFVVGLGAPQQGPRPMRVLNDFLDRVDGSDRPIPQQQRILAALGPRKLELARDRFGGAITLLVTPEFTAEARRVLGPERALVVDEMMVLDTDAERARAAIREPLGFLLQVPGYRQNALRLGFTETEIDALDDRLVDALATWGDADSLVRRVRAQQGAGADHVVIALLDTPGSRPILDRAAELAHRLQA